MPSWDVFHSDRLELARGLTAEEIRAGLASGSIRDDDLVRPSGTSDPWGRVAEVPELMAPPPAAPPSPEAAREAPPEPPAPPAPPPVPEAPAPPAAADLGDDVSFPVLRDEPAPAAWRWDDDEEESADDAEEDQDEEDVDEDGFEDTADEEPEEAAAPIARADEAPPPPPADLGADDLDFDHPRSAGSSGSRVALPTARSRDYDERLDDAEEDEDEGGGIVSLRRAGPTKVEELDLAAMVDVAFQLVLFFLVTATTILYKTLEIPKPSGEAPPEAVAQGRNRTLDDLKEDYILVEIDPEGKIKIDREPVAARLEDLAERLRSAREKTRRTMMLLSADFATPHRSAVLAYDAANEIGLGIAIAKPQPPAGPAPALRPPAAKKAGT